MVRRHPVTSFKVSCVIWSSFFPHNNSTSIVSWDLFFLKRIFHPIPRHTGSYTSRLSAGKHLPIIMAKASLPNWLSISEPTPSERRRQFHMDWPWWRAWPWKWQPVGSCKMPGTFLGPTISGAFLAPPCEEEWIFLYISGVKSNLWWPMLRHPHTLTTGFSGSIHPMLPGNPNQRFPSAIRAKPPQ